MHRKIMALRTIHISMAGKFYRYKNYAFEWHHYCGPMKLKPKTLEPANAVGIQFYKTVQEWVDMSEEERETYLIIEKGGDKK